MTTPLATMEICNDLIEDSPNLSGKTLKLNLSGLSLEEDRMAIFQALKQNTNLRGLALKNGSLSLRASLALAAALSDQPALVRLELEDVYLGSGFCAVALAIRQSKNLTELKMSFKETLFTAEINETIRCPLEDNSLEMLEIRVDGSDEQTVDLAGVLCKATRIEALLLWRPKSDSGLSVSEGTVRDLCQSLETNKDIKEICLSSVLGSGVMERIALAATGHQALKRLALDGNKETSLTLVDAKAISTMLSNAPALSECRLTAFNVEYEELCVLLDGLKSDSCKLPKLQLSCMNIGNEGACYLADVLSNNEELVTLSLVNDKIRDSGAISLAEMLKQNSNIEILALDHNKFGPKGTAAITDVLSSHNESLRKLYLWGNRIQDEGAYKIAQMLTENSILETVGVGKFGEAGLNAFAAALPLMRGVKSLEFTKLNGFTPEVGNAFVKGLEGNTVLENIEFCSGSGNDKMPEHAATILPQVNYLLALNRGGRKILKASNIRASLWPLILARSSHDPNVLYFFLREKPADLIGVKKPTASRKRKRDD